MAKYGLYKNIEPSSITSAVESLKTDLKKSKQELTTLNNSLSDDIWKCSAKGTLKKAFNTIDSEVYTEIDNNLNNLSEIASLISKYKKAEQNAEDCKNSRKGLDPEKDAGEIARLDNRILEYEKEMDSCVSAIESKC